jgi:hypothetical protein
MCNIDGATRHILKSKRLQAIGEGGIRTDKDPLWFDRQADRYTGTTEGVDISTRIMIVLYITDGVCNQGEEGKSEVHGISWPRCPDGTRNKEQREEPASGRSVDRACMPGRNTQ